MLKQINSLTSTRAFAALLVVILHGGYYLFPFKYFSFFSCGGIAVSYFFVLSGFVLTYNYIDKEIGYKTYLRRRIARIAPVYYLAMMLFILPHLYIMYMGSGFDATFRNSFLLSTLFMQSWFPEYAQAINPPAWSLSVEMCFYLSFPLLLTLLRKWQRLFIAGTILLWVLSQCASIFLLVNYTQSANIKTFVLFSPVFHMNQFLLGMCGALLLPRYRHISFKFDSFVFLVLTVLFIGTVGNVPYIYNGIFTPLFLLLILSLANKEPQFLKHRILVFLGEISYSIYILQKPISYIVKDQINVKLMHLSTAACYYLYLVVLITLSALSYKFIEKPLRKSINRIGREKSPVALS